MLVSSVFSTAAVALATVGSALAAPAHLAVTHIGTKGALYTSAVATKDMIFVSGAIPWANGVNGTIPTGIEAQTATAIKNIAAFLEEAGTSWENAIRTTVFLQNMDDYEGMNKVYGELLPNPKPARTTVQVSKLPGKYLIEMDLVAALPRRR